MNSSRQILFCPRRTFLTSITVSPNVFWTQPRGWLRWNHEGLKSYSQVAGCLGGLETVPTLVAGSWCMKEDQSSHHLTDSFQEMASICQKWIRQQLLLPLCINNNAYYIWLHIKYNKVFFTYLLYHLILTTTLRSKDSFLFCFSGEITDPEMDSFIQQNFACVSWAGRWSIGNWMTQILFWTTQSFPF